MAEVRAPLHTEGSAGPAARRAHTDPGRYHGPVATREDALIEVIRKVLSGDSPGVRLGPGDDAALVDPGAHLGVLTVDMLVEGVDFLRPGIVARDLGYRPSP